MDVWQLFILALIQGLTEFLPISSSAHLILVNELINTNDQGIVYDVAVHFGTLFAAIIYFRSDVLRIFKDISCFDISNEGTQQFNKLLVAVIPILLIGFLFRDYVANNLRSPEIIAYATIFFGLVLYVCSKRKTKFVDLSSITFTQAFIIGLSQCFALIPGTSRSGITISAGLLMGIGKEASTKFSFLLAIPTIGLIALAEIINLSVIEISEIGLFLVFSFFVSFIAAYLTIGTFLKFINRISFTPFVVYRLLLGIFLLLFWI